jgi:glucose-6-phosphate 1-epimerase
MQTLTELNETFAIPGALVFESCHGDLLCAHITTEACTATIYLHGAHIAHWQPIAESPVIFLSKDSLFAEDKAIRGGIPVIFPWFGPRTGERTDGPMHGFARTQVWQVAFAAISGDDLHLTLTLGPTPISRGYGYDNFRVAYEVIFGRDLTLRFSVANQDDKPLHFEEALHTYLHVKNAEDISITGLGGVEFLDKVENFKRKHQLEEVLHLTGTTDRLYLNTEATITVDDPGFNRQLITSKKGSKTAVVWNPWKEGAAKLPDLGDDEWEGMVCIETVNANENALTLHPGEAHTMESKITLIKQEDATA